MPEPLEAVRSLKTTAKNRRSDGRFEEGVGLLGEALSILDDELERADTDDWRSELASELADCYGLVGGIQRRWGFGSADPEERAKHLKASVAAYEAGDGFEREEAFGVVNSYNLVNRLIGRLLLDPSVDLRVEMTEAKAILDRQLIQKRHGDIWALADLALLRVLLGEAGHASAWQRFRGESPPDFAYESVLDTLEPLAELDLAAKAELEASIQQLEADFLES